MQKEVRHKNFQEVPQEGLNGNHQEVADEQQFCCNVRLGEGNQLPQPDSRQDDRRQGDRTACGCSSGGRAPRSCSPCCCSSGGRAPRSCSPCCCSSRGCSSRGCSPSGCSSRGCSPSGCSPRGCSPRGCAVGRLPSFAGPAKNRNRGPSPPPGNSQTPPLIQAAVAQATAAFALPEVGS